MKTKGWTIITLVICTLLLTVSLAGAQYVPDSVRKKIAAIAKERYPENEVLQQRMIALQTKAYFKVRNYQNDKITNQQMRVIKGQAARKFPKNYVRQLTFLDKLIRKHLKKAKSAVIPIKR